MRFYRLGEIPTRGDDEVFKASARPIYLVHRIHRDRTRFAAARNPRRETVARLVPAGFHFLPGPLLSGCLNGWFRVVSRQSEQTSWLMRGSGSGVIIKYRSFRNWRFPPEDLQAVGFDYSKMRGSGGSGNGSPRPIRPRDEPQTCRRFSSTRIFALLTGTLPRWKPLQAEQRHRPKGRKIATVVVDYPVQVLPGRIVRVRWNRTTLRCVTRLNISVGR